MVLKILFLIIAIAGVALIFFVSWFWRLLLAPMIIIMLVDVVSGLFKKKRKKS